MRTWLAAILAGFLLIAPAVQCEKPRFELRLGGPYPGFKAPDAEPDRVDINRASLKELMKVPGLKRGWALRIIRYRPYYTKADLYMEGVIPGSVYKSIRDGIIAHRMTAEQAAAQLQTQAQTVR
jgi:hypothetical protein